MTSSPWTSQQLPSFAGRTVVITGANSGLGLVASTELARVGAHVVLAVRDLRRGEAAARTIGGSTEVRQLDLADLGSVHTFAEQWTEDIDVLINNAGVASVPRSSTAQGFESQFGINHLGPFALTNLLLPHVTDRVVTLSSALHRSGTIDFDDLNWERRKYDRGGAYAQSKLANLLFNLELQRRLSAAGSSVRSVAAHPGYANTNLATHSESWFLDLAGRLAGRFVAQSAEAGTAPVLFAASQDIPGGSFVGPHSRRELKGHPALGGRSIEASDPEIAERLWRTSEQLTGVPSSLAGQAA